MADETNINLAEYLKSVTPIHEELTFGSGAAAFEVQIKRLDKRDAEQLFKAGRRKVRDRRGDFREEQDPESIRYALAEKGLAGWDGLTLRKVLLLTNKDPALANGKGEVPVNYSVDNAVELMRVARGIVNGEPVSFEEWLLEAVTKVADQAAAEDAAGKNG